MARKITSVLEEEGLEVWDPDIEILPGDSWASKLDQALEQADAMVVLLTQQALESLSVKREIEYALGEVRFKNRLIPVLANPGPRTDEIPWILQRQQLISFTPEDPGSVRQIARILQAA